MPSYYSYRNWYTTNQKDIMGTGTDISDPGPPILNELYPRWNGFTWEMQAYWVEPIIPAPILPKHITKLAFRQRFTNAERIAIEIAALDKPNGTQQERETAAAIRSYIKDVDAAKFIDLDRADLREGVDFLEAAGLLVAGRADEIITNEIVDSER